MKYYVIDEYTKNDESVQNIRIIKNKERLYAHLIEIVDDLTLSGFKILFNAPVNNIYKAIVKNDLTNIHLKQLQLLGKALNIIIISEAEFLKRTTQK